MRALRFPALALAVLAAASASAAEPVWTAAAEAPLSGATDVRETRWESARPPGGAYDHIRVHRYRTAGPAKAALLYLPGTNQNGQVALADEDHNLWVFLARRGVEVYALDYRTAFPPSSGVERPRLHGGLDGRRLHGGHPRRRRPRPQGERPRQAVRVRLQPRRVLRLCLRGRGAGGASPAS